MTGDSLKQEIRPSLLLSTAIFCVQRNM